MLTRTLLATALAAVAIAAPSAGAARPYDPARDYETTALCYAAFLSMTPAFFAGTPEEMRALDLEAYRGFNRLKPYATRATAFSASFENRALESHRRWDRSITGADDAEKTRVRTQMRMIAAGCQAAMDEWGAPPFTGEPPNSLGVPGLRLGGE